MGQVPRSGTAQRWINDDDSSQITLLCGNPLVRYCGYDLAVNVSGSNLSTTIGLLCRVIDAQVLCPRLRAGSWRQRCLVRHGADRTASPCGPWLEYQLGRGDP